MELDAAKKMKENLIRVAKRLEKADSLEIGSLRQYAGLYDQVQEEAITLANSLLNCAVSEGFLIEERLSARVELSMQEFLNSDYFLREKALAETQISKGNAKAFFEFCQLLRSEMRRIVSDEGDGAEEEDWKAFWQ